MKRFIEVLMFALLQLPGSAAAQAGVELAVDPEPVLTIGGALEDTPERSFTDIAAIAVLGDSILVLDAGAQEVKVFDHEGRLLGRIGRAGEGPGEFGWPTAMWLNPEGIAIVDLALRRQSLFTFQGELLRTEPLGRLSNRALAGSAILRGGVIAAESAVTMSDESGAFPERLVVLVSPDAQRVDTVARYSTGYVPYHTADSYGFLEFRSGSEGDWAVAGDSLLAVVSGEPSTLRWWHAEKSGLTLGGTLALPVQPEAFTQADARLLVENANERRRADGDEVLPRSVDLGAPDYWGQVKQLVVSDDEVCWIQWDRPRVDEDDQWFRADLKDRRLARVTLPLGFRMLAAIGEKVYGVHLTEYDVPQLTVFRLR